MPVRAEEVGPKINLDGLTYAPINEQGVVLLFGMICKKLGFSVETIRQAYPDAIVIDYRTSGRGGRGLRKSIEFEYSSSSFGRQKHNPADCDIVVCWEHDWEGAPEKLEIIELSSVIPELKGEEVIAEIKATPKSRKDKQRELPVYMSDWNARLNWIEPATRTLTQRLIERISTELPGVVGKPRFRWYSFYRAQPYTRKNDVATILIGKKNVKLSIRVNPKAFLAGDSISKRMAGFFYPRGTERRMPVTLENLESVVKLARTAYQALD